MNDPFGLRDPNKSASPEEFLTREELMDRLRHSQGENGEFRQAIDCHKKAIADYRAMDSARESEAEAMRKKIAELCEIVEGDRIRIKGWVDVVNELRKDRDKAVDELRDLRAASCSRGPTVARVESVNRRSIRPGDISYRDADNALSCEDQIKDICRWLSRLELEVHNNSKVVAPGY